MQGNRNAIHTPLLRLIAKEIQMRLGKRVRVFIRNNGAAEIGDYVVRYGIPGACDVHGYIEGGIPFEIEVKTGSGVLSKAQKAWRDVMASLRVPWTCIYCTDESDMGRAAAEAAAWAERLTQ